MFLRKYGTGTGADVIIPIVKRGVVDFAVTADWTPASGDVKVSKDGGTEANIGTLPVINGTVGWQFVFSDAELQCKSLTVRVVDSATKAIEDQFFIIETYGHASAMFQSDLAAANLPANVVQISGDSTAADNAEAFFDGTGYAGTNNVIPTVSTVTNGVTVTTNNDKTGYSLSQAFPSNFGSMSITVGGAVTAGTVSDKTGYSLTATTGLGNQTADITGSLSGSVGSVTGNVGGNVTGTVGGISGTLQTLDAVWNKIKAWLGAIAGKTADTATRTEINATTAGASYNETTDSQEAIRDRGDAAWTSGSGSAGTVNVLPASGVVADRAATTTLKPVVGETISQAITVYQSDGTTAVDLSGKTLAIIFETMSGTDVSVVEAADITIGGTDDNVVTFSYPAAVTASVRTLKFAIRDASAPKTMYLQGVCSVVNAPSVDT